MGDIYDSAFRTVLNDCQSLIIPILNLAFGESYTGKEKIDFLPNEHFIAQQNDADKKRITDTNFIVYALCGKKKKYHCECQSTADSKMLIRLFEYDAQIALDQGEITSETLTVEFPHTAVLYLRGKKKTDTYKYVIKTPGGTVEYDLPLIKMQTYSLDEIFEKKLYMLIPFYIFCRESELDKCNENPENLEGLKREYQDIIDRMLELVGKGELSYYDCFRLLETADTVIKELAKNYKNVVEGVSSVMGGELLESKARRFRDEGLRQGLEQGIEESRNRFILNMLSRGMKDEEIMVLAECSQEDVELVRNNGYIS